MKTIEDLVSKKFDSESKHIIRKEAK